MKFKLNVEVVCSVIFLLLDDFEHFGKKENLLIIVRDCKGGMAFQYFFWKVNELDLF